MKLLLADLHHLGDAALTAPLVRGAARQHEVHVLCRPPAAEIFAALLPPERIHPWQPPWHDDAPPGPSLRQQARALRDAAFDLAACAWADSRVHLLFALARIPRRAGFRVNRGNYYGHRAPWRARRLRLGQLLAAATPLLAGRPALTIGLQRPPEGQTHLDDVLQLARACGIEPDLSVPWFPDPRASLPPETGDFLAAQRAAGRMLWLVHPGARLPTKRWPTERFAQVVERALAEDPGLAFAVIDRDASQPWPRPPEAIRDRIAICRPTRFTELLELVARSDAALCHDSLLSHLAAAQGKPVAAIFGSGDPAWFAPWQNAGNIVARDICPYRPCVDRCRMPSPICVDRIEADEVMEPVRQMTADWRGQLAPGTDKP